MTFTGEIHPIAALFPLLPDDDLKALADDIAANGLLHPIVLDPEGRLLDGRNRLRACEIAGVEPEFITYDGGDPDGFILSLNIQRRQLSKGQAAMLAAEALSNKYSQRAMARYAGVSQGGIKQAAGVRRYRPDLVAKIIADVIALGDAYAEAQEAKRQIEQGIADANIATAEHVWWIARMDPAGFLKHNYPSHTQHVAEPLQLTTERIDAAITNLTELREGIA